MERRQEMLSNFLFDHKQIDEGNFSEIRKYFQLKVTESLPFPPEIIKVNGTTVATLGNFSASTGKPKSKKTFNVCAIVAAALSGKTILNYTAVLPPDKNRILYIDTEQSRPHCHKVLKRILKLAGLPTDKEDDNIDFFVLREYTPEQRRTIVKLALQNDSRYGLVIIDGIRDLMHDINNSGESIDIINDLMRWSSYYKLHIHTVLHLNKADDNTRGHIGTELNNKAETVLQVTKDSNNGNMSEVKAMHIRDKEFTPFAFAIGKEGLPFLVDDYETKVGKQSKYLPFVKLSDELHRKALEATFKEGKTLGYGELIDALTDGYNSIGYKRGRNTIVKLQKYLQRNGAIVKKDREYSFNPDFELDGQE